MVTLALCALVLGPTGDPPHIANLWGCSPASTEYDSWSRYDLLVLTGGSPSQMERFSAEYRRRNSGGILLGTAPLMNLGSPEATPWMEESWFLRKPDGEMVTWWADQVYTPNLLIDGCLEALVAQTAESLGAALEQGWIDGVFFDSVVGRATWLGPVDTDGDGVADDPAEVDPRWHARQCEFFDRLRARYPGMLILANDVDLGHAPHLHGRLFEGGPLLDGVANGSRSCDLALRTLAAWREQSLQPPVTFALMSHPLGWQPWRLGQGPAVTTEAEVDRVARDFRRMRLGLLLCLMSDTYAAYDVGTVWYGLTFWYPEYDAPLGRPLGPVETVQQAEDREVFHWRAGEPTDALSLEDSAVAMEAGIEGGSLDSGAGWRRLFGTDPRSVPLAPGETYEVRATVEVLEAAGATIQFQARTPTGGWERHDKAINLWPGTLGTWEIGDVFIPDDFEDYSLEWHLNGAGRIRLTEIRVIAVEQSYLRREFEGGIAVLNRLPREVEVDLGGAYRRFEDPSCPRWIMEVDDADEGFMAEAGWERVSDLGRFCGTSTHQALKPGATATWSFTAPSTDTYTILACAPKLEGLTDAARFALEGPSGRQTVVVDQREGEGGWVMLLEAPLTEGEVYRVTLESGGTGITVADAVRIESAAPRHDGSLVRRLVLAPLDGEILLKVP